MTPISATVTSIEQDIATVQCVDGQTLRLPLDAFAGTPTLNTPVHIIVAPVQATDAATRELSRHIINEFLGSSPTQAS
ncbi:MAG: hypothetical protein KIH65_002840 [Candidatus Uhrbacteria bacterium]|nr:hypothetical protein [Candidatus Uhrbacteria bacterium]